MDIINNSILQFIPKELIILVIALYILGVGFKNLNSITDKYIPVILLVIGIVLSIWMLGFSPTSIIQGILCWGVSIGINQTFKQLKKSDK